MTRDKKAILTSIKLFGIYSLVMGLVLLLVPQFVLPLFNLHVAENDTWLRLLGFVLCCSSYYYIRMAAAGSVEFARLTVHTRFLAPVVVIVLIISGKAGAEILSFGIVDGLGGLWTWLCIRRAVKNQTV
jgi:hypothetical protein